MAGAIADLMMAAAVVIALVAMWRLLRAMAAALRIVRAGHAGPWLLYDPFRFHDATRAPPAAREDLARVRAAYRRILPLMALAFALALPAAILAR
jgi:hypothetical protein